MLFGEKEKLIDLGEYNGLIMTYEDRDQMYNKFIKISARLTDLDDRLDELEERLDELERR